MARPLRVERAGAWYHLTARGNERQPIYRDPRDYEHFLELLGAVVERFRWRLHAYVLMKNHFHLLVETNDANLSASMQWLGVSYTVWFNRRHGRSGHLFQGRFKSIIVDPASWGVALSTYLHLNPVRVSSLGLSKAERAASRQPGQPAPEAELVRQRLEKLRAFRWSSYRAYLGLVPPPRWLSCDRLLESMGAATLAEQQKRYREQVERAVRQGASATPWDELKGQMVLGPAKFLRKIRAVISGNQREQPALRELAHRPAWTEVITVVEKLKGEPWADFCDRYGDWGRDLALYLGRRHCQLKLGVLGQLAGGVDYTGVAMAVRRFEHRLTRDRKLFRQAEKARAQLCKVKM